MDWKKIFRLLFKREPKPLVRDFDRKLVKNLRRRFWPTWRQFCYIGRFFSRGEKAIIWLSAFAVAAALITWGLVATPDIITIYPKAGGEYSEALIGAPQLINPIFSAANDVDADIAPLLYARLFRIGENQKIMPELAVNYTISEDNKSYAVKLREDALWTDGEKIDADDVLYTFEAIQNPETNSPLYPAFNGVKVEKTGPYSVLFTLKEPFAPFVSSLSVGILPEHIFGLMAPANLRLAKENLQPKATSGAWKFFKLTKNESGIETYTLEKNERYFGAIPYIKKLTFTFYQDLAPAIDDLKTRTFMGLAFLPRNLSETSGGKNYLSYKLRLPQYTALFFNENSQPALKDDSVRLALAKAIDKPTVAQSALGSQDDIIDAPILSGFLGYYPEIQKIAFNADEASALLDKTWPRINPEEYFALRRDAYVKEHEKEVVSLPDFSANSSTMIANLTKDAEDVARATMRPDQTFYRKNSKNEILSINLTTADTPEYQTAAEAIALLWRSVGVQTSVITVPGRQISREVLKGRQYDILLFGEILGDDPDPYPFWHSSQTEYPGLNLAMFSDRNADKLLEDARVATSTEARAGLYVKFQDMIVKELPAIFLYTPTYEYLIDKKVKNVDIGRIFSPADRFNGLSNWYIKTKWGWK
jgi:peptide/nickel transport system substrate-binding protein